MKRGSNMNTKTKNVLLIISITLAIALAIALAIVLSSKNDDVHFIEGTVLITSNDYLLIETEKEDYLIADAPDGIGEKDRIKVAYKEKNVDESSTPKSIEPEDITILEKYEEKAQEKPKPPTTDKPQTPSSNNPPTETIKTSDEEVLEYVENLETDFKSGSIKESLKSGFVTVIDFLFYGGSIKGHTFSDLSNSAKLKVLSLAMYFDEKIDKYFPGYKESISKTTGKIYTTIKNEILSTYLNVATKVCEQDGELCIKAKEEFGKIKTNLSLTWSLIKDIAGDGLSNLKNWYEIWSGK